MQTAIKQTTVHHYLTSAIAYRVLVIEHLGRDHRVMLDLDQWGPLGWEPLPERDVRDWCCDLDLPVLGLDRDELVRVLADRHGVEDPLEQLRCDDAPHYSLTSDDVDSFAREHGE